MPSEAAAAAESRRRPAAEMEGPEEPRREKCPRCESRDTKFCYYNNYNTSQPRHFCRSCRRYWTLGGSLRNVPIGGSSRSPAAHNPTIHHNHPNKRLRTAVHDAAPPPLLPLRHVAPLLAHHQLVGGPGGYQLAALGEPFRFELGLGMGPMGFMWASEETWRMEGGGGGGGGECYAAAAPVSVSAQAAEVSGGPDGDRVR